MPFGVARHNMYRTPFRSGSTLDANAVAWGTATGATGARVLLVSNLITSLKAAGVWTLLNRLWLFANENATEALTDLVALAVATAVNTPTFTTDRGYAGNGTTSYVNLGSANAGTQDSSAYGFYNRSNTGVIGAVEMGASRVGSSQDFNCNVSVNYDGNLYFALNDENGDLGRAAPADVSGIYVNSRTGSTTATIYRAGASFATNGQTSSGVPTTNYCVGAAFDRSSIISQFSPREMGMAFLGNAGFSGTDAANLTTYVQTYMTAVGA